jgi:hypothetical protein
LIRNRRLGGWTVRLNRKIKYTENHTGGLPKLFILDGTFIERENYEKTSSKIGGNIAIYFYAALNETGTLGGSDSGGKRCEG